MASGETVDRSKFVDGSRWSPLWWSGFVVGIQTMQQSIHEWARRKGFWEQGDQRNKGEMIALMHSELSEMMEATRKDNQPSEHIPDFTAEEEELADIFVRGMDYAAGWKLRLAEAIVAKMAFNEGRPYKHGKKC